MRCSQIFTLVIIGEGKHTFPSRTRPLSPQPPMVVQRELCESRLLPEFMAHSFREERMGLFFALSIWWLFPIDNRNSVNELSSAISAPRRLQLILFLVSICIPRSAIKSMFLRGSLTFFYNFEFLKTKSPL
jgi:hypothetical protein